MKWNDFLKVLQDYLEEYPSSGDYSRWAKDTVWEHYRKGDLTEDDVKTINNFLKDWKMARVIGKRRKEYGENEFISKNRELAKTVKPLFEMSNKYAFGFEDAAFIGSMQSTETLFYKINELLGPTIASKIMHMVNPTLFIMWDATIREHWGCIGNPCGYFNFLNRMRIEYYELVNDYAKNKGASLVEANTQLLEELNLNVKNIPITRWIDIYNWYKFTQLKEEV